MFYRQQPTLNQQDFAKYNAQLLRGLNKGFDGGIEAKFRGVLGETIIRDDLGLPRRNDYGAGADRGEDMDIGGVKVDIKTVAMRGAPSEDGFVLLPAMWLSLHELDKITNVLLFCSIDVGSNELHAIGWIPVERLKALVGQKKVKLFLAGWTLPHGGVAKVDTLLIQIKDLFPFINPNTFRASIQPFK